MTMFELIAILTVLAALFNYLNVKVLKLPGAIGVMILSLLFSVGIVAVGTFLPMVGDQARALVDQFELGETLLTGMLGFLLFAGALHVDLGELARQKWPILLLAVLGTLVSTALVGLMTWGALTAVGISIRPIDALLFGTLISPTDPIAVLGLLKRIGAPKALEIQIAGESLFNDGIGVVLFIGVLEIAVGVHQVDAAHIGRLFLQEAVGGVALGLVAGLAVYFLLRSVDDYQVEVLLSLALVAGGYALADVLHVSGPIAMVVAGLLIGNHGRSFAMSPTTTKNLDLFWELIDEALNAVLFLLVGLEVLVLSFTTESLTAGLLAIPIVLVARGISVGLPLWMLRPWRCFESYTLPVLTWGGLRGGISVALALAIPGGSGPRSVPGRDLILSVTYTVVVFSILAQGLTIGPITRRLLSGSGREAEGPQQELQEG